MTMNQETKTKEYTVDAADLSIGRVATKAAVHLMGKDTLAFERRLAPDVSVTITNASKVKISRKKREQKTYIHYTGYPGGKREQTLAHVIEKKGYEEVFRKAVYGMLPANRLRAIMMKNLKVVD